MNRNKILALVSFILVVLVGGGIWLWNWVLGSTQEASGPIQAAPLQLEATQIKEIPTQEDQTGGTQIPFNAQDENQVPAVTASSGLKVFEIVPAESQVSFNIYEELLGQPNNVIGTTDQVAGEFAVDLSNLSTTQVGEIQVNARTLVTDDNRRNRAIYNRILNTNSYEFITFTPKELIGLGGGASTGQTFSFQINGDLKIRDISTPVLFDVTAQLVSEDQIKGSASATIQRSDYNLTIPSVRSVANVGEDVVVLIDFVAGPALGTGK